MITHIVKMPEVIVNIIKEYIPKKSLVFTNKTHYILYHAFIKTHITNFENYIRDTIRRDNEFVFEMIMRENYKKWYEIKNYKYKNMIFKNYFYFVINYCIENDSNNCRNIINEIIKQHGLCKNLHKKNIVKYIRWRD